MRKILSNAGLKASVFVDKLRICYQVFRYGCLTLVVKNHFDSYFGEEHGEEALATYTALSEKKRWELAGDFCWVWNGFDYDEMEDYLGNWTRG